MQNADSASLTAGGVTLALNLSLVTDSLPVRQTLLDAAIRSISLHPHELNVLAPAVHLIEAAMIHVPSLAVRVLASFRSQYSIAGQLELPLPRHATAELRTLAKQRHEERTSSERHCETP